MKKKVCFSFVVDADPIFYIQALNLIATLLKSKTAKPEEIVVHVVEGVDKDFVEFVEKLTLEVHEVKPIDYKLPRYCNKLRQLENESLKTAELVVLLDTDIAFTDDVRDFIESSSQLIRGKVVDLPNPPLEILEKLRQEFSIKKKPNLTNTSHSNELTFDTNWNGGFYIIPSKYLDVLYTSWTKIACDLIKYQTLLGRYFIHTDQISFCLSLMQTELPYELISVEYNFPIHLDLNAYDEDSFSSPKVLHYHKKLDCHGFIEFLSIPKIDQSIKKANEFISFFRKKNFDNKIFWEYRYQRFEDIGSGIGSRGENLETRKKRLYPFFYFYGNKQILDVGCGDLELSCMAECENYTGVDISGEAIKIARKKRTDWNFIAGDFNRLNFEGQRYDLVYCGAVLIHQPTYEQYLNFVSKLVELTEDVLIVEGYDSSPLYTSDITFYYEPITETLKRTHKVASIKQIGSYRDISIILAKMKNKEVVDLDLFIETVYYLYTCPNRKVLREIIQLSFDSFGWFTETKSRFYEYPYIVEHVENMQGDKKRVLEIGAGVNPLPLYFSKKGCDVITIDNHETQVDPNKIKSEWGFLDYSFFDKTIKSFNIDALYIDKIIDEDDEKIDIVYSVSTLEHILSNKRRGIIKKIRQIIKPGGILLLTIDLIPNTELVWNYSEGKVVEDTSTHGTIEDVLLEINREDFTISDFSIVRGIWRTDIALIKAIKI